MSDANAESVRFIVTVLLTHFSYRTSEHASEKMHSVGN